MAQIPDSAGFGQITIRPTPAPAGAAGALAAFAAPVGQAFADLSNERDAADRAQAAYAVGLGKARLKDRTVELGDQVLQGDLSKDEADGETHRRGVDAISEVLTDVPQKYRQQVERELNSQLLDRRSDMRAVVKQKDRDDIRGSLHGLLDVTAQDALIDLPKAKQTAAEYIRAMGAKAGYGADDQQRLISQAQDRYNAVAGERLIFDARDNVQAIDQALTQIRSGAEFADLSPQRRLQLEQQATTRKQYLEHQVEAETNRQRIEADRLEQQLYGTALLQVETNGKVDSEVWQQLDDSHRASILNRQKAEAKAARLEAEGRPVKTDWKLYLTLREQADADPKAFAKIDLKEYVDRLGGQQLEQLQDIKTRAVASGAGLLKNQSVTLTQQMTATMQSLGIKRAESKGQFLSFVQGAVDDAEQAKGSKLSYDERQKIIDQAVLKGPDPDALFFGQKRMFELTPEQRTRFKPNAPTDAPPTEIEAINEALKAQGLPQTPANRLALYRRVKGQP